MLADSKFTSNIILPNKKKSRIIFILFLLFSGEFFIKNLLEKKQVGEPGT